MKNQLLLLYAIAPNLLFGQDSLKIANKDKEVYYVINTNQSGRNGNYKKLDYLNDSLRTNGYYKNGIKDSVWSIYNEKGELEQKFDFTRNELLYYKKYDELSTKKYKVWLANESFDTMLERPPLYIGGQELMFDEMLKNLNYPDSASKNAISGNVLISFVIDKNGKAKNKIGRHPR